MQKQTNIPYKVQGLNTVNGEIIIRSAQNVEEASSLAHKLSKLGFINVTWGWCNKELTISDCGSIS